jgi:Family of unknown function (DUF6167)
VRRLFWLALGATAGVLVVRKITKTAHAFTPAGLVGSAGGIGDSIRYFADEVRAGMVEREAELRDALGIDGDGHDLSPEEAADLIERPAGPRRRPR